MPRPLRRLGALQREMMMRLRFVPLIVALLAGCGDGNGGLFVDDCNSEISAAVRAYGEPQTISQRSDAWYHSVTYRWPYYGVEQTFTWGGNRWGCSVSGYRFPPVRPPHKVYPTERLHPW